MVEQNVDSRKIYATYFSELNFQYKVIKLENDLIYNYNLKMTKVKKEEIKVSPNEKWYYSNLIPLFNFLSISARAPLWHMAIKKVKDISNNM